MISAEVLDAAGLNTERLKAIFTATKPAETDGLAGGRKKKQKPAFRGDTPDTDLNPVSPSSTFPENPEDWQIREFFEQEIRSRLQEGITRSLEEYRMYQAADMALDGTLLAQFQIPLGMLAQGYINIDTCYNEAKSVLADSDLKKLFEMEKAGKRPVKLLAPKLTEISLNVTKSLVTRRVAAISTPIRQRTPLGVYDPQDTSLVGRLKGDMMTQRFEQMSDDFGYRPAIEQTARDVSMYGHQVEFITKPWEVRKTKLRRKKNTNGTEGVGATEMDWETYDAIEKEGVDYIAPHPSRKFWDRNYPLRKINTDTGGEYIGYWDVSRIGALRQNKELWNHGAIEWDTGLWDLMNQNQSFFRYYYREAIAVAERFGNKIGLRNDAKSNVGTTYQGIDDAPCTLAYYFRRLNPKQWGIADYDYDVWIRFVVAGKSTVIWADVCGSTPAIYYGYNESDQRAQSSSFASDAMQIQDQVSNLLSQLLDIQGQGLTRIYALNVDGMKPEEIEKVENALKTRDYSQAHAIIIKHSAEAMKDMGVEARSAYAERLKSIEISTTEKTSEIFRSIMNLLSLGERQLFFSPQELGQVAPREITATEANMVNNTTLGIRDFHAIGIEEGLDVKKKIAYESAIAFGSDKVTLSVMDSYSRETVEAAGFTVISADTDEKIETVKSGRFTLSGNKYDLVHNYVFTSRDGTERAPSAAEAQATVQYLDVLGKYPALGQCMTVGKGVEVLNRVSRRLGVSVTLRVPAGVDPSQPMTGNPQEQFAQFAQGVQQALQAITKELGNQRQQQDAIASEVTKLAGIVQTVATRKGTVSPTIPSGSPPLAVQQADAPFAQA